MSWGSVMAAAGHMGGWGALVEGWRKGPWTSEEDILLNEYVRLHGEGRWNSVARLSGLKRNGKSCRLRWVNYLRPDLKRGRITPQEETIIIELHARWGNRWSTIARSLPGRTDNEIKNYWRTHFKKKGNVSLDNSGKAKTRLLKRQQFQQQQQQQQLYLNQVDIKKMLSLLDESETKLPYVPQMRQDMVNVYNPHTSEEQGFFYAMMNGEVPVPEAAAEDMFWDGLWNLDDVHANFNGTCATS